MSTTPSNPNSSPSFGPLAQQPAGNRPLAGGFEGQSSPGGLDLVGAVLRRKYIIILACIVGAVIGYLGYSKEVPQYSSWSKLMIWEQAPPSVVDGEWIQRRVSVTKHQNLLGSELVLSSAIQNGELQNLETFRGKVSPVASLKQMLSISSIALNDDDTILLTCTGPVADDLPTILNQIVKSYQLILAEDSKSAGQESIALVEKLQEKLLQEKKDAEERYLELSKILGPVASNSTEKISNPHLIEMQRLQGERLKAVEQLQTIEQQLRLMREVAYKSDEDLKRLLVIEANRYLDLELPEPSKLKIPTKIESLRERIVQFEALIIQKELESQNVNQGVGDSHPIVIANAKQMAYLQRRVKAMKRELRFMENSSMIELTSAEETEKQLDDDLIRLYGSALKLKQKQLLEAIGTIDSDLREKETEATEVASSVVEINLLRNRIEEKRNAIQVIFDRLSEIDLVSSDYNTVRVKTIDSPGIGRQVSPVLSKSIGYAVFLAGLAGLGLALLIDRLDLTFRTSTEIAENLGIPVVGTIPRIRQTKPKEFKGANVLSAAYNPRSRVAEAFRAIRTAMFFAAENGKNCFLLTSPSPGDGKSTITSNLAISIAQTGKRVCLVDADFRRPMIKALFNSDCEEGMLDVMRGDCTLYEAVTQSLQENLFVISTGGRSEAPGEVVTSPEFEAVIKELRNDFDFVLIDSPPIGPVADASVISRIVDAVYLVLRIRKGVRVSATTAVDNLFQVEADIKGIIVNDLDQNPHYSDYGYQYSPYNGYGRYNYGYGYGYGNSPRIANSSAAKSKQPQS